MDILFNNEGTPLQMTSQMVFGESVGKPSNYDERRNAILSPFRNSESNCINYKDTLWMKWGKENEFPLRAAEIIASTSVLNTGLRFLRQVTVGQGIYACEIDGYDAKGNEILKPCKDEKVNRLISSRMIRKYIEEASRDYFKFGNSCVQFVQNITDQYCALKVINALNYRLSVPKNGKQKVCVSSSWPDMPGTDVNDNPIIIDLLNSFSPETELCYDRVTGKKTSKCVSITDSWSNNDFYGEPIWLPAYILGWVDIAHQVPKFLRKAYENQITWKWHVQIPYSYWEKKFPPQDYTDTNARKKAINEYMNKIEQNLCGAANAEKPLFTMYAVNEANGKIEEEWKIQALDNKYKGGENLVTSAAANSEILFCLCVNPNVLGAMPSGNYGSNQGGSNIREAFLVNIANAWIDRQNLLDPIYMLLHSLGMSERVQLRYRNTVLTTLDTGAGTTKTLS